jgi:hypothetical protein
MHTVQTVLDAFAPIVWLLGYKTSIFSDAGYRHCLWPTRAAQSGA